LIVSNVAGSVMPTWLPRFDRPRSIPIVKRVIPIIEMTIPSAISSFLGAVSDGKKISIKRRKSERGRTALTARIKFLESKFFPLLSI